MAFIVLPSRPHVALAVAALVTAGCGLQPSGLEPGAIVPGAAMTPEQTQAFLAQARLDAEAALAAERPAYGLRLAPGAAELDIEEISASSVKNDYFRLPYATDGNTHSAWGPDLADAAPTLSYKLSQPQRITDLKIKLSPAGVTMTVRAKLGDGAWQTIATGVVPPLYEQLVELALPPTDADQLEIAFSKPSASTQVLVCETHWFGIACPPPVVPTPAPPDDCGFVMEGAGALTGRDKATFAVLGARLPDRDVKGFVLVYTQGKKYIGRVNVIQQQDRTLTMSGPLLGTPNETFTLVGTDGGKKNDTVFFTTGENCALGGDVHGFLKFKELPCEFPKHPCKARHWGKFFR